MSTLIPMFKKWWINRLEANREYYESPVTISNNWEPAAQANLRLKNAMCAAYAEAPEPLIRKFASVAVEIVDRAVAEDKFQQGKLAMAAFPRNRAEALQTRAYAKTLLGEPLPAADLLQASHDFETRAKQLWNHQYQAYYLNGVRTALIAGDQERFIALLNTKRKFKWHEEEYGVLRSLADALPQSASGINSDLRDRFRTLFDRYRNPEYKPDVYLEVEIARFELGAIWCRWFDNSQEFRWPEVVQAVSA